MNALKMKNILMIVGFTLLIMQPGTGSVLPPMAVDLNNATGALASRKATNGTTATTMITTMKPMTPNPTPKKEQPTTKGTTAAAAATTTGMTTTRGMTTTPGKATTPGKVTTPGKATTAPRKDVGYMAFINDLFDLENSMKRQHQKRRVHGAPPTKAGVGGSIVAHPLMYYNMGPPRMQAARIDLKLSYKPGKAVEDRGGNVGPLKHGKPKVAPTLPPLIEMLTKPQQHPDMPALMEFLNGIVDLVINTSSSNSNESKPYGYFNKTVSPDGKFQTKEFGLRAPNVVIKGVQQETNYDVPAEQNTFEGLEFLGPPFKPMKMPKKVEKVHHYGLPSEQNTFEGLEFLSPPFKPFKMPKEYEHPHLKQKQHQQHRREGAEFDVLSGGVDKALRKNYDVIDRLLEDLNQEDDMLQVIKDATKQLSETTSHLTHSVQKKGHTPKEELLMSCPIHHEFHADRFGDIIEEDVIEVGECEAVKVRE